MGAHVTFANKIAQAVLSKDLQWEAGSLDIATIILTEEQKKELNMHFLSSATPSAIRSHELFFEKSAETDKDIESQLQVLDCNDASQADASPAVAYVAGNDVAMIEINNVCLVYIPFASKLLQLR